MTTTPLERFQENMAKLLEANPGPIDPSTVETRWRADVAAWAAGDTDVKPVRPPVRVGVKVCSARMRWDEIGADGMGILKRGLVVANADRVDGDSGEIIEAWEAIGTPHGVLKRFWIDTADILDWHDGILEYTGEQHWETIRGLYTDVKKAAGRRSAAPWLDGATVALYGLIWRHDHGGDDG